MPLSLEQYVDWLHKRDLPWPAAPTVEAPRARPHLVRLPTVRAVTWSVYGTLLSISLGDLVFEHPKPFIMEVALDKTIQEFNMWASMTRKAGQPADYMKQIYAELLQNQTLSGGKTKHPELLSERIWEAVLKRLLQKEYKFDAGFYGGIGDYAVKIAYFFHASLQGTACYEGAAAAIERLAEQGVTQTLLSDAQTFTVAQLKRGLRQQNELLDLDMAMPPVMRALSCEVGSKKPAENLFRHALTALRGRGITPEQVLHIGSRIALDVVPAKRLGMRTALFAGDTASLQATVEQLKAPATRPDVLLTKPEQVLEVVPL